MRTMIVPFLTLIATLVSAQSMASESTWYQPLKLATNRPAPAPRLVK